MSIEVTQDAINQMNHILEKNGDAAVRYELKAGGCGGIIAEWGTEPHHEPEQGEQTWPLTNGVFVMDEFTNCLLYTSPSPRDQRGSRMPSSA